MESLRSQYPSFDESTIQSVMRITRKCPKSSHHMLRTMTSDVRVYLSSKILINTTTILSRTSRKSKRQTQIFACNVQDGQCIGQEVINIGIMIQVQRQV